MYQPANSYVSPQRPYLASYNPYVGTPQPVYHPYDRYYGGFEPERMITSHIRYEAPVPAPEYRVRQNYPYMIANPEPVNRYVPEYRTRTMYASNSHQRKRIFDEQQPPLDNLIHKYRAHQHSPLQQSQQQSNQSSYPQSSLQSYQSYQQPMHQSVTSSLPSQQQKPVANVQPVQPSIPQNQAPSQQQQQQQQLSQERERKQVQTAACYPQIFAKTQPLKTTSSVTNNPYLDDELFKDFDDKPKSMHEFMDLKPNDEVIHRQPAATPPQLPTPVVIAKPKLLDKVKHDKKMQAILGGCAGIAVLMILWTLISYYWDKI